MDKLAIFNGREKMGEIRPDQAGELEMTYFPAWLSSGAAFAISPHLPLEGGWKSESVRNFLANLLPEGEPLEELSRNTGCSKANIFGLIAAIGTETSGALSFVPDDAYPPPTSFREITAAELSERIAARKTTPISIWDQKPRLSVAGVQDKLPVLIRADGVMGFGEGDLASTHILKFGKDPELHLVLNEYLCMQLASMVGLSVAEAAIESFGEPVLSVRRFDRRWEEGKVSRLHVIDGCQLLNLSPIYKYERPFGKSGHAAGIRSGVSLPSLFNAGRDFGRVPAAILKGLLDWVLFQLIIGNSDAHGKNVSFFMGKSGIALTPSYDLVCLDLYRYDRDLALAVGDCFDPDQLTPYDLALMCDECRLPPRMVARTLDVLCDKTLSALDRLAMPQKLAAEQLEFADKLTARIAENARRLKGMAPLVPKMPV